MKYIHFTLLFIIPFFWGNQNKVKAQYDPLHPPNTYRSNDNPNYWKNSKPFPGYWQQDVHYRIKAKIDDETDIITGSEQLTYWNNSPDTLHQVFFHLYQNAFQPGSYYHKLLKNNNKKPRFGKYEQQGLGTTIQKFKINGRSTQYEIENTILQAKLSQPLMPGESLEFSIEFKTYFDGGGSIRRRMKIFQHHGYKHYDGVHWYPRISVYDRKFKWTTDQHMGREFYGDFGTYDVELTFPVHYVVGATGYLQNRREVLPRELRKKLDITNFANKPFGEKPSVIIPATDNTKTWKFHAENVHDFAFTADPTYRIGEKTWNGVRCIALVQEQKATYWQNIPNYTANVVKTYSQDYGKYVYPKIIVADARDGMEYPMLTLCGGTGPGNHSLIAHEVGHNWFFGMLGNNESYRASMDEGFTQFITSWALDRIEGKYFYAPRPRNIYEKWFIDTLTNKERGVFKGYLDDALKNKDRPPLNTHSDDFNGALHHGGGYRQVYYKMATMLYNLRYVLGEELFLNAMQHYVSKWKIKHPYFEDFKEAIMDYANTDLNWFFDQWFTTSKSIDYAVKKVKKGKEDNTYLITFERLGEMQMPLKFTVTTRAGKKKDFLVPNNFFVKSTGATVLPRWIGWGNKLNPDYTAKIKIEGKIRNVVIDPDHILADEYQINNRKKGNVKWEFDSKVFNRNDIHYYHVYWRPDLWYNEIDGIKAGLHFHGNYMDYKHKFHLTAWYNTGMLNQRDADTPTLPQNRMPVNFNFRYSNPFHRIDPDLRFHIKGRILDGWYRGITGFRKKFKGGDHVDISFSASIRPDNSDLNYLLYPNLWRSGVWNNFLTLDYQHSYRYHRGKGDLDLKLRNSAFTGDYNYTQARFTSTNKSRLWKLDFNTRVFTEYTLGRNIAPESRLYLLYGARPELLVQNKFTRSRAFVPHDWLGFNAATNHFHHGGGLNLRGYSGYLVPVPAGGTLKFAYRGTAGASINAELGFDRLIPLKLRPLNRYFHLNTYFFGDAGVINTNNLANPLQLTDIRGDAGLGTALTIKKWGPLKKVKPLTLRFDMPFYLSHRPFVENNNLQFRWIVGVERAF